ncbi:DUF916 domain-containing protein [Candidatus Pacebacteria bacterium]|nr:DUF916 domain-containing protein [Candidatus Paceibacterota bacterium]
MSNSVHNLRVVSLVCALFFLSVLPYVALSEEDDLEQITTNNATEETTQREAESLIYPTESLLGDKVIGDFVLGPGKVELEMDPGETKTVEITVSNRIGETHVFFIDIEDLTGSRDASKSVVLLGDDTGPYTLKDYISIPDTEFDLDHNLRARIPVTISIPDDAEPGGHYGSVLLKTVTKEASKGDSETNTLPASAIISRIGTLFFITVSGETDISGELQDFSSKNNQKWYEAGPINFNILYENTGSVHLNPYGELRITNMFDEEVGFVELEPWFTLPQSVRLREISWNRDFLYGRYTATIYLNRGYDDVIDEMSFTFWVIPWKIVLGGLATLFIIFFIFRGFFRRFEFKKKVN